MIDSAEYYTVKLNRIIDSGRKLVCCGRMDSISGTWFIRHIEDFEFYKKYYARKALDSIRDYQQIIELRRWLKTISDKPAPEIKKDSLLLQYLREDSVFVYENYLRY